MFRDPRLARMASFLGSIGIEMRAGIVDVPTLFRGSLVSHGSLKRLMKRLLILALPVVVLFTPSLTFPSQIQDTAIVDQFISKQAKQEDGEEYADARKMLAGDLNRDGVPDVAVLYTIEGQNGTNNYLQYLAVFVRTKGKLVPAAHTVVGGKLNRDVDLQSIKNNVIRFKTLSYRANDPASTPSKKGTARFMLIKRRLKEL